MNRKETETQDFTHDVEVTKEINIANYDYDINIKVVGIGGAGNNAIDGMYKSGLFNDVQLIAVNSDVQDLQRIEADKKIIIGGDSTGRLGTGFHVEVGRRAAQESREALTAGLRNADLVFLIAGMGGGTGTGATPEIIKIAQELDILVVTFTILPFDFEGQIRRNIAKKGLFEVKELSDGFIVVSNDKLIEKVDVNLPMMAAFKMVNDLIQENILGIIKILRNNSLINIDFADLQRLIIKRNTELYLGTGYGSGDNAVDNAVTQAASTPFIATDLEQISFAIIHLTIGKNIPLSNLSLIESRVVELIGKNVDLIIGIHVDEEEGDHDIVLRIIGTDANNSLL